jgi:hypothetical protein
VTRSSTRAMIMNMEAVIIKSKGVVNMNSMGAATVKSARAVTMIMKP